MDRGTAGHPPLVVWVLGTGDFDNAPMGRTLSLPLQGLGSGQEDMPKRLDWPFVIPEERDLFV